MRTRRSLVALALACACKSSAEPPALVLETEGPGPAAAPPARPPDAPYIPTPELIVDRMLELARVSRDDVVYDLGCGDGRIVIAAARRYGAHAVGFDIDPERVAEARRNVAAAGVESLVRIERRDVFELDLTPATVVTLYLLPELNVRLLPQLERLRPGARIVSHDFDIAGVVPSQTLALRLDPAEPAHDIYFFETPLRRAP